MSEPLPDPESTDFAIVRGVLDSAANGAIDPSTARDALQRISDDLQDANDRAIIAQAHDKNVSAIVAQQEIDIQTKANAILALETQIAQYEPLQTERDSLANVLSAILFCARSARNTDEVKKDIALDTIAKWAENPRQTPGDFVSSVKGLLGSRP